MENTKPEHSSISPSKFKADVLCPDRYHKNTHSIIMNQYDNEFVNNQEAKIGTAAHELLLEGWLTGEVPITVESYLARNGVTLDYQEDILPLKEAFNHITELLDEIGYENAVFYTEFKVDPGMHWDGKSTSWGTADLIIYDKRTKRLYVIDYKHGAGILVDVYQNYQLMLYAIGALTSMQFSAADIKEVSLTIAQPRISHPDGPFRSWTISKDELLSWVEPFQEMVNFIMAHEDLAMPNVESCRWCSVKPCKAMADKAAMIVSGDLTGVNELDQEAMNNLMIDPATMSDESIKLIMDNAELIKMFLNSVKKHVDGKLHQVPIYLGYKLVRGRSSKSWTDKKEADTKKALKDLEFKIPEYIDVKLKSPAAVLKAAKANLNKEKMKEFEALYREGYGAPTAVPESDARPPIIPDPKSVMKPVK